MDTAILESIHNILRWAVLLFGVLALFSGMRGLNGKQDFTNGDKRTALYLLISCDVQLLLGLALYMMKGYHRAFSGGGMGEVMKNAPMRFWSVEHLTGMVIAIVLVHVGYAGTKGNRPHAAKFRRLFWCVLIAMLIMVATIPWPFRQAGIAQPWIPGMGV
jgi:peptidoglycan/LPS O-acetylase OafA/YrhL